MGQAIDKARRYLAGQWMALRRYKHQWVFAKRPGLQVLAGGGGRNYAQVRHALGNRLHDAQARQLLHIHADAWVFSQVAGQQLRQVLRECSRVAQQAHLALLPLNVLAQVELQALDLLRYQPGMLQQCLAGQSCLHATAVAFQQRDAQRSLHGADPRTGCCQRKMAAAGTGGDVAALQGVLEQPEVDQIEMHVALSWQESG
ncbi:Uncharacterised protein [Pseudomonas putida]|nr:Uncharacterised protein [Pseudomonas putida]CAB5667503.1 Uncharacterised protein [Pseudomonas putida]